LDACAATCGGITSPLGISKLALAQKIIVSANIVAAIAKLMCLRIWVTSNWEVCRFAKNVCEVVHTHVSLLSQFALRQFCSRGDPALPQLSTHAAAHRDPTPWLGI
jgi:hypothetical protein